MLFSCYLFLCIANLSPTPWQEVCSMSMQLSADLFCDSYQGYLSQRKLVSQREEGSGRGRDHVKGRDLLNHTLLLESLSRCLFTQKLNIIIMVVSSI